MEESMLNRKQNYHLYTDILVANINIRMCSLYQGEGGF